MTTYMFFFTTLHDGLKRYGLLLSGLILCVITVCSLIPPTQEQAPVVYTDKIFHMLAYAALTFPCSHNIPKKHLVWGFSAFLWGAGIECLQPSFGRTADVLDAICNGIGALVGILSAILLGRLHHSITASSTDQTS